jgi:hypothetical protein
VIQVKGKRKTQKEANMSGRKDKKKVLRLVGKLEPVLLTYRRSFLYIVKMEREIESW